MKIKDIIIEAIPKSGLPKKVHSVPARKSKLTVEDFTNNFMKENGCGVRDLLHQKCEEYADAFVSEFGGVIWVTPEYEEPWGKFYHYFIQRGNKFYDGSVTQGVDVWHALPVFKDYLGEAETYQPPELAVGDKILKGKFKNSPAEIKGFKKDKHNQPVLKTNKGEVQLFKPRVTKLMTELNYPGNIGIMEVSKFYETAPPHQIKLFKELIAAGKNKEAWRLLQLVTNSDIESDNVFEGGWASTLTQNTIITPKLVQQAMKLLQGQFIPALNQFLKTKGLADVEISRPGGSATYYERDLKQQPNKEYGDVDVQFHIARIPNTTPNANTDMYRKAIAEFCGSNPNYSSDNGTNVILKIGNDYVQVDLITSFYENKNWTRALAPEWNMKGVLCNSLYSSLGEALNLSIGGGHGVQAKMQNGTIVPFKQTKDVELKTVTNKPESWAIDIVKFLGCTKAAPLLKQYSGLKDEVRVADMINSIKGIAQTLELNGKGNAAELIQQIKKIYLDKIDKAINSSKYDKAETVAAIEHAKHTKEMLASKSAEIAALFDK